MDYLDAYALAKKDAPEFRGITGADFLSPELDLTRLRRLCEMALVRAYDDWYYGNPSANISKAIHAFCRALVGSKKRPVSQHRRVAGILAWTYCRLDHDSDDAYVLLEHVLRDTKKDAGRILPPHLKPAMEEMQRRWREDRGIPEDLTPLSSNETAIWDEVLRWEVQPQSLWTPFAESVDVLKARLAGFAPDAFAMAINDALQGGMHILQDAAESATRDAALLADIHAQGHPAETIPDLKGVPIEVLDRICDATATAGKVTAGLEGAGAGFGGPILIAADIPLLMGLNLRFISQVAHTYGFSTSSIEERMFVLNLLGAASADRSTKSGFLNTLNKIAMDVARGATWKDLENHALVALMRKLAEVLGFALTKRKLAQIIPVAGAAVGAGANYAYTRDNLIAAKMMYRKRWLIHRCSRGN